MEDKIKKHHLYYFFLVLVLISGFISLMGSSHNKPLQMIIVSTTALFYAILGIMHHFADHDLSIKIVVEYMLISTLGVMLFAFLLQGVL